MVLCLAIPNLRIRKSPFPSIFTFGSMNALQSVQEVDEFIHNCFRDRHCPSVDDGSFKKAIGQHHEALDSFNGFLAAYTFLLVKTRSQGELKRACLETMDALERNGYLFSSHTVDFGDDLSSEDHTLLLLLKLSTSVNDSTMCCQCVDQIGVLVSSSLFMSTSSKTLEWILSALFLAPFQREKSNALCLSVSKCVLSITSHPQWKSWELLGERLFNLRDQLSSPTSVSFVVSLCTYLDQSPFQLHLLSSLLLPLVEEALQSPKQSVISTLVKQSVPLASFLLQFLPASAPSLPSRSFLLWTDCLTALSADSQWNADSLDSIVATLVLRLRDSKAFAVQMRCVTTLLLLLQREKCALNPSFRSALSCDLLHLIQRDDLNERVCCRILEVVSLVVDSSQRDVAICIVGKLLVQATKRDRDVLADTPNALRKQASSFFLHMDQLPPESLLSFCLLPMVASLDWLREQEDWLALVKKATEGSVDRIQRLYRSSPLVDRVVDWILDETVDAREKRRWIGSWDGRDLRGTSIALSCASSLSDETLNQCIETALSTGGEVDAVGQLLIKARKTELLLPRLEAWLVRAESSSLSMDLSSALKALTFLPFSSLQSTLIQLSSSIRSDENVIALLRLLRVITVVIVTRNERQVNAEGEVSTIELTLKERNVGHSSLLIP